MWQKYFLSLTNQGLVSLFHFSISLVLVRLWEPVDFGVFALAMIVIWTTRSVQGATLNTPLSVHAPRLNRHAPRALMELALSSINAVFILLVFFAVAASAWLTNSDLISPVAALAMAAYAASALMINYMRAYLFSYLKAAIVTAVDVTFVSISGFAIALALYFPDHTTLATVFGLLAAGSFAGAMVGLILSRSRLRVTIKLKQLAYYRGPWRDARWALASVGIFTVHTKIHAAIVAATLGPEAFAILAAGNILFGPIRMLMVAWGKIARPYLARAIGQNEMHKIGSANRLSFIALGIGFLVLFSSLYLFWPFIEELVYRGKYQNIGMVVVFWGFVSLLGSCRNLLAIPLQSMLAFRQLAILQTAGALTSVASVVILVTFADFRLSILGLALGEGVNLLLSWNLYRRQQAQLRASQPISRDISAQPL